MSKMGLTEADMRRVEADILATPEAHPLLRGLKRVRKARFARRGTDKSGGGRAIYFLSYGDGLMVMLTAFAKSAQEDLTPEDRRAILRVILTLVDQRKP
jgi:hypothetical protein